MAVGNLIQVPLNQKELDHLEDVIGEMELKTSGEIRLMIVHSSIVTSHVFFMVYGWLASASLFLAWIERHRLIWLASWWLVPSILLGLAAVSWILAKIPLVIRLVTPQLDQRHQVLTRAEVEFHREGLSATAEATGVLLFLSMLERQAVVLADKGIASKLAPDVWNNVIHTILEGPKTGEWAARLEKALRQCGAVLAQHFPIQPGDKNELPNSIIVKR